jgi:GNAT superfamily N-acetyltransferase
VRDNIQIVQEPATEAMLHSYAQVPIAFQVKSILRVDLLDSGLGGIRLVEEAVAEPYLKDWPIDGPDEGPVQWARRWDTSDWAILSAYLDGRRVGGVVLAVHNGDMWFLRRRSDTAALWDIRVDWDYRGQGIGHALFNQLIELARRRGYRRLMIETQNTNVAACRFYARQGCYLGAFERHAYEDWPEDVELTWYYDLD